jgi:hypothetical protein
MRTDTTTIKARQGHFQSGPVTVTYRDLGLANLRVAKKMIGSEHNVWLSNSTVLATEGPDVYAVDADALNSLLTYLESLE